MTRAQRRGRKKSDAPGWRGQFQHIDIAGVILLLA
jgi:hypothetical protein